MNTRERESRRKTKGVSKGNRINMHRDLTALAAEKVIFLDSGVPGQGR